MVNMMDLFKWVIMIQLFYSFGITMYTYALPSDSLQYVYSFSENTDTLDMETVATDVQDSLEKQTNIPVIDVGALVFYSGNILIDLILNFLFALPQMMGFLIYGIFVLLLGGMYTPFLDAIQLFASVILMVMYAIGVIEVLLSVRSGRIV